VLEWYFEEYAVGTFEKRTKDSNLAEQSLALLVKQCLFCFGVRKFCTEQMLVSVRRHLWNHVGTQLLKRFKR